MGSDIVCSVDKFAVTIDKILNDVSMAADTRVSKAVEQSTTAGVNTVKWMARGLGRKWSSRYIGGFKSRISKAGGLTIGEIGNKAEPGLVHLLEHGHATLNGRRTRAFPHMEPAKDEIEKDLIQRVYEAIGEALEG